MGQDPTQPRSLALGGPAAATSREHCITGYGQLKETKNNDQECSSPLQQLSGLRGGPSFGLLSYAKNKEGVKDFKNLEEQRGWKERKLRDSPLSSIGPKRSDTVLKGQSTPSQSRQKKRVRNQAYLILFHPLCVTLKKKKKQDKLHCFHSKSLVLYFPYIYLLKKCYFDQCHPCHPHTRNSSERSPPCKATAGDSQLVLITAIPNRIFIRQMRSLTAALSLIR